MTGLPPSFSAKGEIRCNTPEEKAVLMKIGQAAADEGLKHGVRAVAICAVMPSGFCSNAIAGAEAEGLAALLADGPTSFSRFIAQIIKRIEAGDEGD